MVWRSFAKVNWKQPGMLINAVFLSCDQFSLYKGRLFDNSAYCKELRILNFEIAIIQLAKTAAL